MIKHVFLFLLDGVSLHATNESLTRRGTHSSQGCRDLAFKPHGYVSFHFSDMFQVPHLVFCTWTLNVSESAAGPDFAPRCKLDSAL